MDQRLLHYIAEQRERGVNNEQLKLSLLRSGYPSAVIDTALSPNHPSNHKQHFPSVLVIIGFIVAAVAIGFLFFTLFSQTAPTTLLDLNTEPIEVNVEPGSQISFIKELANMGSSTRYDVVLTHTLFDPEEGMSLLSKTETVAIETRGSSKTVIDIPDDIKPGYYLLQTTADYDGKQAIASFLFKVYKQGPEPTCFDNIQNQDEEGIDCGGACRACNHCSSGELDGDEEGVDCGGSCIQCIRESCFDNILNQNEDDVDCGGKCLPCLDGTCFDGKRNQNEEGVDCGGVCRVCTREDRPFEELDPKEPLLQARELAKTDPDGAQKLCKILNDQAQKDECLAQVADESDNRGLCNSILIPSKRDSCLLSFALEGDYTVCGEISNIYLMNSCLNLEKAALNKELEN